METLELLAVDEPHLGDEFCFGVMTLEVEEGPAALLPEGRIAKVRFPTLMLLDRSTPDGRLFPATGFSNRDLPLTLFYKNSITAEGGHSGAVVAGSLEEIELSEEEDYIRVSGWGYLVDVPGGHEALTAIKTRAVKGVSADLTGIELDRPTPEELDAAPHIRYVARKSVLSGLTIVPIPAFPETTVELDMVASARVKLDPVPKTYFQNPRFTKPTGWTIQGDRVMGHLALRGVCHVGRPGCELAPMDDDFSYFRSGGTVDCDDGTQVRVGRVFLGGEHAPSGLTLQGVMDYYAATSVAVADVVCGHDEFGIWVSGVLRPGISGELAYAAQASAISGHWKTIKGQRRLLAILNVNAPGFPVADTGDDLYASASFEDDVDFLSLLDAPGISQLCDMDDEAFEAFTAELNEVKGYYRKDGTYVKPHKRKGSSGDADDGLQKGSDPLVAAALAQAANHVLEIKRIAAAIEATPESNKVVQNMLSKAMGRAMVNLRTITAKLESGNDNLKSDDAKMMRKLYKESRKLLKKHYGTILKERQRAIKRKDSGFAVLSDDQELVWDDIDELGETTWTEDINEMFRHAVDMQTLLSRFVDEPSLAEKQKIGMELDRVRTAYQDAMNRISDSDGQDAIGPILSKIQDLVNPLNDAVTKAIAFKPTPIPVSPVRLSADPLIPVTYRP